jgi:hypothetical protein
VSDGRTDHLLESDAYAAVLALLRVCRPLTFDDPTRIHHHKHDEPQIANNLHITLTAFYFPFLFFGHIIIPNKIVRAMVVAADQNTSE